MTKHFADRVLLDRQSAFTMIEVLVVMLIIGIIVNFIALKLDVNNPLDELKTEARRFVSLAELASEEALLRSGTIGITVEDNSYHFSLRVADGWEPLQENIFRERNLPETLRFKLAEEPRSGTLLRQENEAPDILFLASGEMTPFELEISSLLTDDSYHITGDETGSLSMDHVARD